MQSCLYEGHVRHRRKGPPAHAFNFNFFLMYLDIDELEKVFSKRWLWSFDRKTFARFRQEDYLRNFEPGLSLRERVVNVLQKNGIQETLGPIRLLTQMRYLGFGMNPVSFFYCYDVEGESVVAVIAEVNNTPWGEQHVYVIPGNPSNKTIVGNKIKKDFHVSPFMSLDMNYRMMFTPPGEKLGVKIENYNNQERLFEVSMLLDRKPLTTANLTWCLIAYPLLSFKVLAGIYWHALRLYIKGVRFYPHPKHSDDNRPNRPHDKKTFTEPETIAIR